MKVVLRTLIFGCMICAMWMNTLKAINTDSLQVNAGLASPMACPDGKNRTLSIDKRRVCVFCTYPGQQAVEIQPTRCAYFYRQGPCEEGTYLIAYNEDGMDCRYNYCEEDGLVRIASGCVPYDVDGVCGPGYVVVPNSDNPSNHICKRVQLRIGMTIYRSMGSRCSPGHVRDLQGICRESP